MGKNSVTTLFLAQELVEKLTKRGLTCATAESCTGGVAAAAITAVPGASKVFLGGAVTYTNATKERILSVDPDILETYSAISREAASAMALGVRNLTGADIGVAITGNAGPEASEGKPVGMVFVSISSRQYSAVTQMSIMGSRDAIRRRAADTALAAVLKAEQMWGEQ